MPIQRVNIGSGPNIGDGDPLRTAFEKVNGNFDELYGQFISVTDTTLEDHSDVSVIGSIAWALDQVRTAGGGTVTVSPGTFKVNATLSVPRNTRLLGSGMGSTIISSQHSDHVIIQDPIKGDEFFSIEGFRIDMGIRPGGGDGIFIDDGLNFSLRDISIIGGGQGNWGISLLRPVVFIIERAFVDGFCNGIRLYHDGPEPINFGDGLVFGTHVHLHSPQTTGIKVAGPDFSSFLMNNILISQVEVAGRDAAAGASGGCIGIHLYNSNRITLTHVDSEIVLNCFLHEGKMNGGVGGSMNAFIQCFAIGVNAYIENGIIGETLILGGFGDMLNFQRIPSNNISVFASPSLGYLPLQRNYHENERYTETATPRSLSIMDSGKTLTNQNALGLVEFQLPGALNKQGMDFLFMLVEAQPIRITLGSGDLFRPNGTFFGIPGSGKTIESDTNATTGTFLHIRNVDNTAWCVLSMSGNWTFVD